MKVFLWLLRIVVGILFIFSGLIKANDPLGLSYKMIEFFEVMNIHFLADYSLAFSIIMIAFEIIAGVALLLGYAFRLFSFLLLLLIIFFTFLTGYALFSGKIKECGCFGDCIKLQANESFIKDVVLLVLILILFAYRKRIQPLFPRYIGTSLMILATVFSFGIQWYVLEHLPIVDCLPYKVGNNIYEKTQIPPGAKPDRYEDIFIYEKDGKQQEFTMDNYPWEDTTWKFVDRITKLVEKGNAEPEIKDFVISDYDGGMHTEEILQTPGYAFLLFVKDPKAARDDNMEDLRELIADAQKQNIPFYMLASSDKETADKFLQQHNLTMPVYVIDGTVSKTAIRANPGLILLEQGTVRGKWSFRDYPESISEATENSGN